MYESEVEYVGMCYVLCSLCCGCDCCGGVRVWLCNMKCVIYMLYVMLCYMLCDVM